MRDLQPTRIQEGSITDALGLERWLKWVSELALEHPTFFRELYQSRNRTPLSERGIEVYEGWKSILRVLAASVEEISTGIYAVQVKEKFGVLRVYLEGGTEEEMALAQNLLNAAVVASSKICEKCGEIGYSQASETGWTFTYCEKHHREGYHIR